MRAVAPTSRRSSASTTTPRGRRATALLPHVSGAPAMETTDGDGTVHRFWQVTDAGAIEAVQEAMAERTIVIADGHHRYETALAYRDEVPRPGRRLAGRPAVRLRRSCTS